MRLENLIPCILATLAITFTAGCIPDVNFFEGDTFEEGDVINVYVDDDDSANEDINPTDDDDSAVSDDDDSAEIDYYVGDVTTSFLQAFSVPNLAVTPGNATYMAAFFTQYHGEGTAEATEIPYSLYANTEDGTFLGGSLVTDHVVNCNLYQYGHGVPIATTIPEESGLLNFILDEPIQLVHDEATTGSIIFTMNCLTSTEEPETEIKISAHINPVWFTHVETGSEVINTIMVNNGLPNDPLSYFTLEATEPALLTISFNGPGPGTLTTTSGQRLMELALCAENSELTIQHQEVGFNGTYTYTETSGNFSQVELYEPAGSTHYVGSPITGYVGEAYEFPQTVVIPNDACITQQILVNIDESTNLDNGETVFAFYEIEDLVVVDENNDVLGSDQIVPATNIQGNVFTFTAPVTYPILTLSLSSASPGGAGIPSYMEVIRFNACADASSEVELANIKLDVTTTDNTASGWNECGNFGDSSKFALYNLDDLSVELSLNETFTSMYNGDCSVVPTADLGHVNMEIYDVIPAGTCSTYGLWVNTIGASSASDDSIQVNITDEEWLIWFDQNGNGYDGSDADGLSLWGNGIGY